MAIPFVFIPAGYPEIDFILINLRMHQLTGLSYYASSMHGICISGILIPSFDYISYRSWQFLALEF
jgi:hypothetical protein